MLALNQLQEERDRHLAEKFQAGDDRKVALLMLQNEVRDFPLPMVKFSGLSTYLTNTLFVVAFLLDLGRDAS